MAHHHHHHRTKKDQSPVQDPNINNISPHCLSRNPKPSFIRLLFILLLFSFLLLLLSRLPFFFPLSVNPPIPTLTSCSLTSSPLCCNTSNFRSDICFLNGDIRTASNSSSLLIFSNSSSSPSEHRIRPYTRKWEAPVMSTILELRLNLRLPTNTSYPDCDVNHGSIPAVIFSTGGYTGNVYHEFNDGIIPIYLTSRRFNGRVIFVIVEYHAWWISKYSDLLSVLSDYPAVDFSGDSRTHCFSRAVVGLQIQDELSVDDGMLSDFRELLDRAYQPRIRSIPRVEEQEDQRPKLVIVSRNGSRSIENELEVVGVAERVGFRVEVLRPHPTTEMAKIYLALNSSDAMVGVHGAAMTHLLFMRRGSVFIQVVPLGLDWAAEEYYGKPAVKAGLRYEGYRVLVKESSLSREYGEEDDVLRDPARVNARGWEATKKVYLDGQKVRLDLGRFRKRLVRAYSYLERRKKKGNLGR